ncbi:MAG: hypothetical protein LUF80_01980 [Oscillospiraceae bacterium]|nr:hypothetical protein [Oscillospiraceae bacterium]
MKIGLKKRLGLDQNADDDDLLLALIVDRVPGVGLADITLPLVDGDPVVKQIAQGAVVPLIGKVEKEKILPVKQLEDLPPLVNADHHVLRGRSGPELGFLPGTPRRDVQIAPLDGAELFAQGLDGVCQNWISHGTPPGLIQTVYHRI